MWMDRPPMIKWVWYTTSIFNKRITPLESWNKTDWYRVRIDYFPNQTTGVPSKGSGLFGLIKNPGLWSAPQKLDRKSNFLGALHSRWIFIIKCNWILGGCSFLFTNHAKNIEYFQRLRTGYSMLLTGIVDSEYQYLHRRTKKELIYCLVYKL